MDLIVEKKLTIYEVSEIREKILSGSQPVRMDLSRVTACDTAGVQLLCSILRTAPDENTTTTILNVSKAITDAAKKIGIELSAGSVKSV